MSPTTTQLLDTLDDIAEDTAELPGCIALTQIGDGDLRIEAWMDHDLPAIQGMLARALASTMRGDLREIHPVDALDIPTMGCA